MCKFEINCLRSIHHFTIYSQFSMSLVVSKFTKCCMLCSHKYHLHCIMPHGSTYFLKYTQNEPSESANVHIIKMLRRYSNCVLKWIICLWAAKLHMLTLACACADWYEQMQFAAVLKAGFPTARLISDHNVFMF